MLGIALLSHTSITAGYCTDELTATPTNEYPRPLNKFKSIAGKDANEAELLVCLVKKTTPMPSNNLVVHGMNSQKKINGKTDQSNSY